MMDVSYLLLKDMAAYRSCMTGSSLPGQVGNRKTHRQMLSVTTPKGVNEPPVGQEKQQGLRDGSESIIGEAKRLLQVAGAAPDRFLSSESPAGAGVLFQIGRTGRTQICPGKRQKKQKICHRLQKKTGRNILITKSSGESKILQETLQPPPKISPSKVEGPRRFWILRLHTEQNKKFGLDIASY